MQDQELFNNYEVKNWNFSPRIYKILAASAIFNVLALAIVAQSNLLTMKGCDSPLVNKVCGVIDALYVGGTILATDVTTGEGGEPGEGERIGNEDVVWVNVADKLTYPEGYFALSNPEMFAPENGDSMAGFNPTTGTNGFPGITTNPTTGGTDDLLAKKPEYAKQNPNVIDGDLPKSTSNPTVTPYKPYKVKTPKQKTTPTKSPDKLPTFDEDKTANKDSTDKNKTNPTNEDKTTDETKKNLNSSQVTAIDIDKTPLKNLANELAENKDFDINKPFAVALNGVLTKDGKLDKKLSKFDTTKELGDETMRNVARTAIERLGESGWFGYLVSFGVEKINFTLTQDGEKLTVALTSSQKSTESANSVASGLNNLISTAKLFVGEDEKKLLEGASVTSNGKTFVLNFTMPKEVAAEMINRKLEEERQKREAEKNKSNSTGKVLNKTQNAGR